MIQLLRPLSDDGIAATNARHGFFTRGGGISTGIYAGLNCGTGSNDDPDAVAENRSRVAEAMAVRRENLVSVWQVHSADVVHVQQAWGADGKPKCDAMVTSDADFALGILTADCGPLLFASSDGKIVGAAHTGWKGALTGVAEATIDAMVELGAKREGITGALGPTISARSYEVGNEFVERFVTEDDSNRDFVTPSSRDGHAMFDLPGYIARRMESASIGTFSVIDRCTYIDDAAFFSYRRATHRGEADYGRMIASIAPART